jgi:hypothetical protein
VIYDDLGIGTPAAILSMMEFLRRVFVPSAFAKLM